MTNNCNVIVAPNLKRCDGIVTHQIAITGQKVCKNCFDRGAFFPIDRALACWLAINLFECDCYKYPPESQAKHQEIIPTGYQKDGLLVEWKNIDWGNLIFWEDDIYIEAMKPVLIAKKRFRFSTEYDPSEELPWCAKLWDIEKQDFSISNEKNEEDALLWAFYLLTKTHEKG